jgi:hypothetical protein
MLYRTQQVLGMTAQRLERPGIADLKRIEVVGKFAKFLVPMEEPLPDDLEDPHDHES